jgi:hypothetical protein
LQRHIGLEPQTVEQPRQPLQRIAAEQFDAVNLTQAPEVMYNAALFYTRGGLSAEWNYNYTGDRLYEPCARWSSPSSCAR